MRPTEQIENIIKKMSFKAGPEMDKDLWASEYRVIFGDLHAETVTTEKLAELEANLPK